MYEQIVAQFNNQFGNVLAPAQKFNALVVANVEKLVQFQLAAVETYSQIGLQQLRAALEVRDPQSLQAYVSNQQQVAKVVGEKLANDAKALAGLGQAFGAEVQQLVKENVALLGEGFQPKLRSRKAA